MNGNVSLSADCRVINFEINAEHNFLSLFIMKINWILGEYIFSYVFFPVSFVIMFTYSPPSPYIESFLCRFYLHNGDNYLYNCRWKLGNFKYFSCYAKLARTDNTLVLLNQILINQMANGKAQQHTLVRFGFIPSPAMKKWTD